MSKNILIIEDDEFFRGLVGKKLVAEGFSFSAASDGREGIEMAQRIKPDLIVLDLVLPTVDGFDVLKELKEGPSTSSIPIIILSNLDKKEHIERGLKLGADDYLVKSQFTIDLIIAKVKNILKK